LFLNMKLSKQQLIEKQRELEARLEDIKEDLARGLDADSEERATQLENRDVLLEIQRVTEEELNRLNQQIADLD
jgi:hypothetical protein